MHIYDKMELKSKKTAFNPIAYQNSIPLNA